MSERASLSALDAAWLRMDRPNNRMIICGMLLFDERVAFGALRNVVMERMLRFHRLRQRVREDFTGWHWEADDAFDLDWHLRHVVLPAGPGALEAAAAELMASLLDAARPMWQLHLFDIESGHGAGSALLLRIHHCYGDGFALLHVVAAMTDANPAHVPSETSAEAQPSRPAWATMLGAPGAALADAMRGGMAAFDAGTALLLSPWQALARAQQWTGYVEQAGVIAAMRPDSATRLKGPLGGVKRLAWAPPLSLFEVKALAEALACTVNDVLLGCVAGALRAWLLACGDTVADVQLRALIPVNLRTDASAAELGNGFGMVFLELPLEIADPIERVRETHTRMRALRDAGQAEVSVAILSAMGVAPEFFREQMLEALSANASIVISNVHGPDAPRWLAGARIARQLFWVPQAGDIGAGISLFSYAGQVSFGIVADAHRVDEPGSLAAAFTDEFEILLLNALLAPWPLAEKPAAPAPV
ncbi:wax ester/triacylglycerol synthase family O-acyltransferase [Noviherbaspirillum pedocola]|uniref:diacylglycerol O-acyltransferase n=1 Tax=Noviherbaspirillum pedocola TaxID=2801341 RepID=A0A934SZ13_9BURK|nr:wax ester/triacylglycerol synthase family O-acyltransferase [Noviherbaspirillum pedocola]MBK4737631.1 wax ester/triacylglycerol synthase family O-acyltransferase [Noviherbaspirillum pedocola]